MSEPRTPGSPEAVAAGCTCPVMDNARGAGRYGIGEVAGWWVTEGCPLHGARATAPADREPDRD